MQIGGWFIKWPITNERIDHNLTCNSKDAILIDIKVDFLCVPLQDKIYELTLKYVNYEGWLRVMSLASRASVLNVCGDYTAREFQTARASVAKSMEDAMRVDLGEPFSARVLQLNLRNIERPKIYQDAVEASESALADIELAKKEEEQKMIQARTLLATASVEATKILALANTTADILVQKAVQEVTEASKADQVLALAERNQALTKVRSI